MRSDTTAPLLVLFHGLEGSSQSHYALAFAHRAARLGWDYAVPHFRGCSGELNLAPRAYHSGDFEEIGWVLQRLRARCSAPLLAVGISLGGNALLRWAEEAGDAAAATARAVAAVCSPIDLAAGGQAIGRGFNRQVYTRMFLRTMKAKALAQVAAASGPVRPRAAARGTYAVRVRQCLHRAVARLSRHRRLLGPRFGQASAAAHPYPGAGAECAQRPLRASLQPAREPRGGALGHAVAAAHGGHVGFPRGRFPGHVHSLPEAVWRLRCG